MRSIKANIPALSALKESYLVSRAKRGDKAAFGKLYVSLLDQIYRYIFFKVERVEVAEDISQEVFIKAFEKIDSFKKENGNFRAWLYTIARNSTFDYLRTNKRFSPLHPGIIDSNSNVEEIAILNDGKRNLFKALRKLPKVQKETVVLSYINGLSNREIAQVTKKTDQAVRAIKHRALVNLKQNLKKYE